MYLSDLIADIRLYIPGVVDEQAMAALQRAARRFFRDTQLWRDTRSYTLRAGQAGFQLISPYEDAEIVAIKTVAFEGWEVPFVDQIGFNEATGSFGGYPSVCRVDLRNSMLRVAPGASADQSNAYSVTSVLIPTADADELEVDAFASEFYPTIVAAALSNLFTIPLFMDANSAAVHEGMYADGAQRAMNKAAGLLDGGAKVVRYGGL